MEGIALLVFVGLVAFFGYQRDARLKAAGQCNVCGQSKPLCDSCGRCVDPSCNGGCIYCRTDLPFGRQVRR